MSKVQVLRVILFKGATHICTQYCWLKQLLPSPASQLETPTHSKPWAITTVFETSPSTGSGKRASLGEKESPILPGYFADSSLLLFTVQPHKWFQRHSWRQRKYLHSAKVGSTETSLQMARWQEYALICSSRRSLSRREKHLPETVTWWSLNKRFKHMQIFNGQD